jgi:FkbM family methyltransferase
LKAMLSLAAWAAKVLPQPVKRGFYKLKPLARMIRKALNIAAPEGMSEARVAAGGLAGVMLMLNLQTEKDYWLGTYEPELQETIRRMIVPGMVVYDLGANIGYVSLLFARAVGSSGRVFAFEALPANLERLQGNLAINTWARVTPLGMAVVDAVRPVEFLTHASTSMGKAVGSAGRKEESYDETLRVEGTCLDEFIYTQGSPLPQAVKIDIEVGEVLALPGMRRLLREGKPLIFLELHGPDAARVAWEELGAAGYRLYRMDNGEPIHALTGLDWKAYVIGKSK